MAGLFQHEALAVLDTLRDPTPASVKDSCGDSNSLLNHKHVETPVGSVTDKDSEPSQGGSRGDYRSREGEVEGGGEGGGERGERSGGNI